MPHHTIDPDSDSPHVVKDYFLRREFSFTIGDDIYIRYQSFRDKSEFEAAIQKKQPHKIDIGAVFTFSVRSQMGGPISRLSSPYLISSPSLTLIPSTCSDTGAGMSA